MAKKSFYIFLIVLLVALAAVAGYYAANLLLSKPLNPGAVQFGYVDMTKLMKEVPGYDELQKLDEQLEKLKAELDEYQSGSSKVEMEKYQILEKKKAQYTLQLKAEYELQKKQIDALAKELSSKLEANTKVYKNQMQELSQQVMTNDLPGLLGNSYQQKGNLKQQLQTFGRDLLYLKDRQIAAKRLEMEKKVSDNLQTRKNELNLQLTAYETDLLKQNQNEKVNLTLKMQVAKSESEYQETQSALKQLEAKENELKEVKKKELEKQFDQYREEQIKTEAKTFEQFKQKLDQEVNAQLLKQQHAILKKGGLGEAKLNSLLAQHPLIKAKKQEYEKIFKVQQAQLETKLKAAQAQMAAHMKTRESYFMKQLHEEEQKLNQQLKLKEKTEANANLQEKTAKTKTFESMTAQRKKLYQQITGIVKKTVQAVAKQNQVQVVLAMVDINVKAKDLTSQCLEKLKEIKK